MWEGWGRPCPSSLGELALVGGGVRAETPIGRARSASTFPWEFLTSRFSLLTSCFSHSHCVKGEACRGGRSEAPTTGFSPSNPTQR